MQNYLEMSTAVRLLQLIWLFTNQLSGALCWPFNWHWFEGNPSAMSLCGRYGCSAAQGVMWSTAVVCAGRGWKRQSQSLHRADVWCENLRQRAWAHQERYGVDIWRNLFPSRAGWQQQGWPWDAVLLPSLEVSKSWLDQALGSLAWIQSFPSFELDVGPESSWDLFPAWVILQSYHFMRSDITDITADNYRD